MIKIFFIIIINCISVFCQQAIYTDAKKAILNMVAIQCTYKYMVQKHIYWNKIDEQEYLTKTLLQDYLGLRDFIDAPDSLQFSLSEIFSSDNYHVFRCYNKGESHPVTYFVAFHDSGRFYLLKNFFIDEMNAFIKDMYGNITQDEIIGVIELYDKTYYSSLYRKYIIDSTNYEAVKDESLGVKPLRIEIINDVFHVSYYTMEPYTGEIVFYKFRITEDANIESEFQIIREGINP